jgi:chitinase
MTRATTRACDKRQPEDIDLTAFTHLNFAFAFFDPTTFQMAPMTAGDETLYRRFTALKSKKPSLKTWIAVGGWSFNDATNVPNTRTAFSDMVASSANRQAFIIGLIQLLTTYNFDGVDLDWEYPTAEDRGGVKADKANFVIFMKELRAALGSRYGISITLPASFWYLRGFDVEALQHHLDWMNVMSYDIHGVWDSGNKHTGPYVRPHTNLTEIEEGLDLLWRAGVEPSKVVLGLGWYGRSFTLANPACNTPNGVCIFSEGGKPGECTQSAGTLTNAEINRIIARGGVTKGFDQKAGVKWISWGLDQWVSYDDGETTQLKVAFANSRCLGGKMIWAVDQDDSQSSSTNDLLGIGPANGVSEEKALEIKQQLNNATQAAAVGNSCYWSFCGSSCTPGWFETTYARGQVAGTLRDTECPADTEQTLCCASGTILGTCKWEGWRGVGLSCAPVCSDSSAIVVARNSNYGDRDCNGGYQAYCCSGFVPSPSKSTSTLNLIGQGGLAKRDNGKNIAAGALICMTAFFMAQMLVSAFTIGMSLVATPLGFSACAGIGAVVGYASPRLIGTVQGWRNAMAHARPRNTGSPDPNQKKKGQWDVLVFTAPPATPGTSSTTCDCYVTYTCRYGKGFDEICDNQRWAITEGFNGASVYHYGPRVLGGRFKKDRWSKEFRTSEFRTFAVQKQGPGKQRYRCEVDEFPMGALREAWHGAHQIVRLVNGKANGAQGNDFSAWKEAVWTPCSIFREHVCSIASPEPPITWAFDGMDSSRVNARTDGSHFIRRYGVSFTFWQLEEIVLTASV